MPGFCLHLISFQLLIGWQRLWNFLSSFFIFLEFFNTLPFLMNLRNVFCWFFLCFWPSFQIIFTFPASAGWVKCEEFWSNEMVDKIDVIFLPSVSSVYSFFFLMLYDFFSFGFQKELFFQIVICRFLLCEIASFCLFFFDEGDFNDFILFVDVLQISSFEGSDCRNFPLFISC